MAQDTFFIADLHLGHDERNGRGGIIRHAHRPFSCIEDHDEALIKNFNDTVPKKALTYIVGDFAWKNHNKYLSRLNGKKILILGNHDRMPQETLRNFTSVHERLSRRIDGQIIVMDHYCGLVWDRSCHGSWQLYGHSHGRIAERDNVPRCDVGVDVWNYKPVPWEVLKMKLGKRTRDRRCGSGEIVDLEANVERNRKENIAILRGWDRNVISIST